MKIDSFHVGFSRVDECNGMLPGLGHDTTRQGLPPIPNAESLHLGNLCTEQ